MKLSRLRRSYLKLFALFLILSVVLSSTVLAAERPRGLEPQSVVLSSISPPWTEQEREILVKKIQAAVYNSEPTVDLSYLRIPVTSDNVFWFWQLSTFVQYDDIEFLHFSGFQAYETAADPVTGQEILTTAVLSYDPALVPQWLEIRAAVEQVMTLISDTMSTEEKLLVLNDYLCRHVSYNRAVSYGHQEEAPEYVWNTYGALVKGDAVCQGYSVAYALLLNRLGIDSVHMHSPNHIWNAVPVDNQWFHIDVTWNDNGTSSDHALDHANFLLTDQQCIDTGHAPLDNRPSGITCTSTRYLDDPNWLFSPKERDILLPYGEDYYLIRQNKLLRTPDLHTAPEPVLADDRLYDFLSRCYVQNQEHVFFLHLYPTDSRLESDCGLMHLNLQTRQLEELDRFVMQARPSPDGYTSPESDGPELRCRTDGLLELVSSNQPNIPVHTYQFHPEPAVYLPTVRGQEVSCFYALDLAANPGAAAWAAFYTHGQLVAAVPLVASGQYFHEATFSTASLDPWDQMAVFLLDQNSQPLCRSCVLQNPNV